MFWKRKKKPEPPIPGENRINDLANRLQQEGRIDELESELAKFAPGTLEGAEKESWYHLHGIIAFQQGNSTKEADLRKQFFARQPLLFEPDNAINFNLLRYQETLKDDFRKTRQKDG